MDPLGYYAWKALAEKSPELLIVGVLAVLLYRIAIQYVNRVADIKAQQLSAITEIGKSTADRLAKAQEAQAIALARISDTLDRSSRDQRDMDLAIRAIADKVEDVRSMTKEIYNRGEIARA